MSGGKCRGARVSDDFRATAAEGYPRFFEELGVRPASKGGPLVSLGSSGDDATGARTREIRAMDIVLRQPRSSRGLFVQPLNPFADTAFLDFQTTYAPPPETRSRLRAVTKYVPVLGAPGEIGPGAIPGIFGFLLNQGDAQFDEIRMATVWMVSPPDAGEDAEPDGSWEPFVQHSVFWNLNWANKIVVQPDLRTSGRNRSDFLFRSQVVSRSRSSTRCSPGSIRGSRKRSTSSPWNSPRAPQAGGFGRRDFPHSVETAT